MSRKRYCDRDFETYMDGLKEKLLIYCSLAGVSKGKLAKRRESLPIAAYWFADKVDRGLLAKTKAKTLLLRAARYVPNLSDEEAKKIIAEEFKNFKNNQGPLGHLGIYDD